LSANDMLVVLRDNLGITCTIDDIRLLIGHYDVNQDFKLDLKEFSAMFQPLDGTLKQIKPN